MMMIDRTRVLIVWHDAHAVCDGGWCELADITDEPCVVDTVGWLLPNAMKGHVVVAQSITVDDHIDSVLSIPVGMIKSMSVI